MESLSFKYKCVSIQVFTNIVGMSIDGFGPFLDLQEVDPLPICLTQFVWHYVNMLLMMNYRSLLNDFSCYIHLKLYNSSLGLQSYDIIG